MPLRREVAHQLLPAPAAWLPCALDRRLASASVSSKAIIAILSKTRPIARIVLLPVRLFVRPIQKARVLASAPLPRRRTGLGTSRRLHPERCPLCSGSDAPPWRVLVPSQKRGLLTDTIPVFRSSGML